MKRAMSEMEQLSMDSLIELVAEEINGILRTNLYEAGLSDGELERLKREKSDLRDALRNCGIGDSYAKKYVKQTIKKILVSKLVKDVADYSRYIEFDNPDRLTALDKFDIILYYLALKEGNMAFGRMLDRYIMSDSHNVYDSAVITEEDIERFYYSLNIFLTNADKLEIIVQRIYSRYKGLGVIDDVRDMKIEGVSAGVSGKENDLSTVWVLYKGVNIHLSFLKFHSVGELERVCMNIYRYGSPGQLSKSKGYIVNEMKDHSRVVVVRPPFSENFAFFVRKFDTIESREISELLTDNGNELVENILKLIVRGCQVSAITGAQGSGKTTLLMSLIGFIPAAYTLRIQEQAFELHLRDIYPMRNILTFRETEYVSGQEGLDLQKKTDGVVNILGEVASNDVAAWMIQMSQVGSLFTLFTHHAKTTDNLIKYMRNALIINGNFNNEVIAMEQVVDAVRFDIHMEKDVSGHRYVERISEIVPTDSDEGYTVRDIVRYTEEGYVMVEGFSGEVARDMKRHLSKEDKELFDEYCNIQVQ